PTVYQTAEPAPYVAAPAPYKPAPYEAVPAPYAPAPPAHTYSATEPAYVPEPEESKHAYPEEPKHAYPEEPKHAYPEEPKNPVHSSKYNKPSKYSTLNANQWVKPVQNPQLAYPLNANVRANTH
ncbi:hypothetical protein IWW50_003492, partial [Coemansia erecta]